jgi:hypothetical protein
MLGAALAVSDGKLVRRLGTAKAVPHIREFKKYLISERDN